MEAFQDRERPSNPPRKASTCPSLRRAMTRALHRTRQCPLLLLRPLRPARMPARCPRRRRGAGSRPAAGGGPGARRADGLPDLRRRRRCPRAPGGVVGRRALRRSGGPPAVAEADLALPGAGLSGRRVHRDRRHDRPAAGAAERPRGVVGALGQMRRENASVAGLARQLGTTWRTVWRAVKPLLEAMAADPSRFDDVTTLGVDDPRALRSMRGAHPSGTTSARSPSPTAAAAQ